MGRCQTSDGNGKPLQGDFAVSVTDDSYIRVDSTENNLITHLLLQSDLRGDIEEVGCYQQESPAHLDLLMRTHGWTRFSIKDVLANNISRSVYEIEKSQSMSGYVFNEFSNPVKKGQVMMLANVIGIWGNLNTDQNGYFKVSGLNFPDSTMILFRGKKQKGGKYGIKVKIEEPQFLTKHIRVKPHIAWSQDKSLPLSHNELKGNYIMHKTDKRLLSSKSLK